MKVGQEHDIATVEDFTLNIGSKEFLPIVLGGMGVDISVPNLALVIARLGGIGHISDAMIPTIVDRHFHTDYVKDKVRQFKEWIGRADKQGICFDLNALAESIQRYVSETMASRQGDGAIFMNIMEKLSMGNARETLRTRMCAALDGGIDGITLGAGLHLNSMELLKDHPRFRDAKIGIIVSSSRALKLFLHRASRCDRMPDYIVVEGPLAGGHLGFSLEGWRQCNLNSILQDVLQLLQQQSLSIPVIAAGGVFTGGDGVGLLQSGASGIQVATRFTVTEECGLPEHVKQAFFSATKEDVVVNSISPTGYPMRMLKQSPAIGSTQQPCCEAFGYGLDEQGNCPYLNAYYNGGKPETTCLCSQMHGYKVWTCGDTVSRLKETSHQCEDGSYQLLTAEEVFNDYLTSEGDEIKLPPKKG